MTLTCYNLIKQYDCTFYSMKNNKYFIKNIFKNLTLKYFMKTAKILISGTK